MKRVILMTLLIFISGCNDNSNKDSNKTMQEQPSIKKEEIKSPPSKVEVKEIKQEPTTPPPTTTTIQPKPPQKPIVVKTNKEIEQEQKEAKILNKLGINATPDGKIVIDPKKTKEFFKNIANVLKQESIEFREKTKDITPQDLGIQTNQDKIIIDTQKSKSFLEKLTQDLEKMTKDIEKSIESF